MRAHQFVLSAASKFFRDIFCEMTQWQQPVVVLKNLSSKLLKLLVEFMYKGSVQMNEEMIEQFLEAGKLLQVEGIVGDTDEVQLLDGDDVEDVTAARRQILNSTASCDNIYDDDEVEELRDADNLRSFNLDLSEIHSRETSLTRELSVNIRRLSKADSRLMAVMEQSLNISSDAGRRSSRLSRSNVNYCEDEEMIQQQNFDKTASLNLSKNSNTRSSLDNDNEELIILEDENVSPQNFSMRSQTNESNSSHPRSVTTNSSALENSRKSSGKRLRQDCQQCEESIAVAEMDNHVRTFHRRRSRQSVSDAPAPARERSLINLGSLYRTKPMESSRSIAAKTSSSSRSRLHGITSQKTKSMSLIRRPDRAQMIRSLETPPQPPVQTSQPQPIVQDTIEPATQFSPSTSSFNNEHSTVPETVVERHVNSRQDEYSSQSHEEPQVSQPIETNAELPAGNIEQQLVIENSAESASHPSENVNTNFDIQSQSSVQSFAENLEESKFVQVTAVDVSSNIVVIGDRRMCKICGLQVNFMKMFKEFQISPTIFCFYVWRAGFSHQS